MDVISQSVQVPYSAPEKLQQLNTHFHTQSAEDILGWATTQFGAQIVLTCSFGGASGIVLLDMVARIARDTPVVFLDTGLLFPKPMRWWPRPSDIMAL